MSEEQDWRLKAELDGDDTRAALDHVLAGVRAPDVVAEGGGPAPGHDVAITHDGNVLFAYTASQASLRSARRAIEAALRRDGAHASITVSHWDEQFDEWLQVDPPLTGEAQRTQEANERDAELVESRTLIASAGKWVRAEVERSMQDWADKLGLRCEIIEHPHLLTTQVAFTVTGPKRKIDEFAAGLKAEELATLRTERAVMTSPL
ncbi:MAG TPA: hypothetical protein VGN13_10505 [Solirubrobacteraceae bacterium]|jgi:hypothetical protein